jgi:peroxiredoxin
MAATESTHLELGFALPNFSLPEVRSQALVSNSDYLGRPLLVIFLCAHCPYVVHVAPEIARITGDYAQTPLAILGITSNDIAAYPQDAPEPTAIFAHSRGLTFPILFDVTQSVAHSFSARCTPDFYIFDSLHRLAYHGQLDDSRPTRGPDRPGQGILNGAHLRNALNQVLEGKKSPADQKPSIGCSIKWLPGNEPVFTGSKA